MNACVRPSYVRSVYSNSVSLTRSEIGVKKHAEGSHGENVEGTRGKDAARQIPVFRGANI